MPTLNTMQPRHLILLAGLSFTACGEDILGPLNDTVFVLRSIDGETLPATVLPEFGGLAWIVVADTIWLENGSKWRRHRIQHREDGVGGDPLDAESEGFVVIRDGILILSVDCSDADCVVPDRLVGDSTRLEMEETFLHDGKRLVFEPI